MIQLITLPFNSQDAHCARPGCTMRATHRANMVLTCMAHIWTTLEQNPPVEPVERDPLRSYQPLPDTTRYPVPLCEAAGHRPSHIQHGINWTWWACTACAPVVTYRTHGAGPEDWHPANAVYQWSS